MASVLALSIRLRRIAVRAFPRGGYEKRRKTTLIRQSEDLLSAEGSPKDPILGILCAPPHVWVDFRGLADLARY